MARTNQVFNGFRWYTPQGVAGLPQPIPCTVASGYSTADIYPGDPVSWVSDGTVGRTAAGSGTTIFGVVHSILQYRNSDGVLVRNGRYLPSSTTWTAQADRSMLLVVPAWNNMFTVQADEGASITTMAAARSVVGENCDHIYGGTASQPLGLTSALLDISTHATTNTLQWRVWDLLEQPGNDATQTRATYIVYANLLSNYSWVGSATGV